MNNEDEKITTTTYNPHKEENNKIWIFQDSKFLPIKLKFLGEVETRSSTGSKIPCLKFENNELKYYLSLWSKPVITSIMQSGKDFLIDVSKDKKVTVINLEE
jgi:hypothetical protein